MTMFLAQLKNELWKLFGKKRTYIGFGAFVIAQSAMLYVFKYTRWQEDFEKLLAGMFGASTLDTTDEQLPSQILTSLAQLDAKLDGYNGLITKPTERRDR